MLKPNPQCDGIWRGRRGEVISREIEALILRNGVSDLTKRLETTSLALSYNHRHKGLSDYEPGRGPSHWPWTHKSPELWEYISVAYKSLSLRHFCYSRPKCPRYQIKWVMGGSVYNLGGNKRIWGRHDRIVLFFFLYVDDYAIIRLFKTCRTPHQSKLIFPYVNYNVSFYMEKNNINMYLYWSRNFGSNIFVSLIYILQVLV